MNISKYLKAGYACLFLETTEIKRAVKSVYVDQPFNKLIWDFVEGIGDGIQTEPVNQVDVLNKIKSLQKTMVVLENFDMFIDNPIIMQTLLNNYETYKFNQVCLVFVGINQKKIPQSLKELIPITQFELPGKEEIRQIAKAIADEAKESYEQSNKTEEYNFTIPETVIESCCGMSKEEIENILALSLIEYKEFNIKTIIARKREIVRATGFMDFINPEPIENLGGLENLKNYINKRKEAFSDNSDKPKIKAMLLAGLPGTGKSLSVKAIASLLNWPAIMLDVGALKGGIVGQTEQNVRLACKTIDGIGQAVICLEEIEKSLGGSSQNLDSGVSQGLLGYFLTWMQERKSSGVVIATANDITKLPPELLRTGRFDVLWFVDFPNENEIMEIIKIMNRRYNSNLPETKEFCAELFEEQWTGAEIEQLAKDIHFDDLETAKENIPLLSDFRKEDIAVIKERSKQFRVANGSVVKNIQRKNKPVAQRKQLNTRRLNLN